MSLILLFRGGTVVGGAGPSANATGLAPKPKGSATAPKPKGSA